MDVVSYQMLFLYQNKGYKWYDHTIFILYVVYVVCHIGRFVYVESFLSPWNEHHLILMQFKFEVRKYAVLRIMDNTDFKKLSSWILW